MRINIFILGLLTFFVLQARANQFLATNVYSIAADQTVLDEQWVMANTATLEGTFKNDLFIASYGDLSLKGAYEGNLWGAAGANATLTGNFQRNVRLTGQTLRIESPIAGNLMAMANTIIIGTNATINGHARLIATSIVTEGTIKGNATITAGRVATLSGTINGDTTLVAPEILLSSKTRLNGNVSYTSNQELLPPNGVIAGELHRIVPRPPPLLSAERAKSHAMWFFAAFLVGVPFIATFPMTTAMASLLARKAPLKCLAVGFVASFVLPILGLMSVSSIIGLPLGALILASWGILVYVSRIIMGLMIGTLILRSGNNSIGRVLMAMASGLAIIYLATLIPAISLPVQMTIVWMGMGSLLLSLLQKRRLIIQVPEELKHLEELRNEQNKSTEES